MYVLRSPFYRISNRLLTEFRRKKQQETESQKLEKSPNPPKQEHEPDQKQLNGSVKLTPTLGVDKNYNSVKDTLNAEYEKPPEQIDSKKEEVKKVKTPTHERRPSRTLESDLTSKRKQSLKPEFLPEIEETTTHKPGNRTPAKKKAEYGTHVVAKSELWDTGNQHRCTKSHQKPGRVSISQDEDDSYMHRTVSERNRHSSQKEKREKSPVSRNKQQEMPKNICQQQCNKLGYFQSTPNVAAAHRQPNSTPKRDKSMYNATSESELLDREILPIFQKLLTERNKSQHNIDYSFGRSCPNISIKCDIVEYL
ncbi:unnamed protein product [Acanthoscelides obtectus]|uniref:Uncharacterized protein n=1 Tax=Acanthoscelides obtectus TaxID=200917 RepID=A0A9P0MBC2_ACAOB|nr:unnamed protein product [Acanthoscelides obtectus]CAK1658380.1 hypothetical protein AOBTE_LOCUS20849 [Acanthoscelides obtectus]